MASSSITLFLPHLHPSLKTTITTADIRDVRLPSVLFSRRPPPPLFLRFRSVAALVTRNVLPKLVKSSTLEARRFPESDSESESKGEEGTREEEEEEEDEAEEEEKVVAELRWLEEDAISAEDDGREPRDYHRRAQLFDVISRVFRQLKEKGNHGRRKGLRKGP